MSKKRKIPKDDALKDALADKSSYGEFISTFNHWTGLEGNRRRARHLARTGKSTSPRKNTLQPREKKK